jgi:RNA polymerase sigma-70 factor (ECF subfamily)
MAVVDCESGIGEDVLLLRRMAQGEEDAVRLAYEAHADGLYRFALRRVRGSVEDAEEIVQDVFVAAVRYGAGFEGRCSAFTWLCTLARGRIAEKRRAETSAKRIPRERMMPIDDESRRLLRKVHDPSLSPEEIAERLDRARLVQDLLDSLTPEQREAVLLKYVEGFSVAEIAQIMKRSVKAVERLLERAKERPRQEMMGWFADESFRVLCLGVLML